MGRRGPNVVASEWWLREHWGRAFDIVAVRPAWDLDAMKGHGWLVVRRGDRSCTVEELERVDGNDPREIASLKLNLEILGQEGRELRRAPKSAGDESVSELEADRARLARELGVVLSSRSWRLTAPLRRIGRLARKG